MKDGAWFCKLTEGIVFYLAVDPPATIYMGKDKVESKGSPAAVSRYGS